MSSQSAHRVDTIVFPIVADSMSLLDETEYSLAVRSAAQRLKARSPLKKVLDQVASWMSPLLPDAMTRRSDTDLMPNLLDVQPYPDQIFGDVRFPPYPGFYTDQR